MKTYRKYGKHTKSKTMKKNRMCKKCNCLCGYKCTCSMKCKQACHKMRGGGGCGSSGNYGGFYAYPYTGPAVLNPHMAYQKGGQGVDSGHFAYQRGGQVPSINLNANRGLNGGGGGGVPAPLVGAPWTSSPSSWPGVSGPHNGVNFSLNNYNNQPDTQGVVSERSNAYPTEYNTVLMGGGKKKKTRKHRLHKYKGGTAGLSNWLSQIGNNLSNHYATWNGIPAYPSVMPYESQFVPRNY